LPNQHYSGQREATMEEGDERSPGRDLEKEMWTTGFKYGWMKMETAAQDRAGWETGALWTLFHY